MKDNVLNIAQLITNSKVNGPGNRDVIWVQGCSVGCKGCSNQAMWSYEPKYLIYVKDLLKKFETRINHIEGITISGGEPTEQAEALYHLFKEIQSIGLSTMIYSGYTHEDLLKKEDPHINNLLSVTDILIDAPFIATQKRENLIWRGSSNQRIILLSNRYNEDELKKYSLIKEVHLFQKEDSVIKEIKTGIW
jgi:anaerobic ribonucleoside-triphosphate reductase activating protein